MLLLMFMSLLYNTGSNSVIQEVDICDRDSVINLHVDGVEVFVCETALALLQHT